MSIVDDPYPKQADPGDYIAYVGNTVDTTWKKNHCLQWSGTQWVQLVATESQNTDFYMRALRDLTDGAEAGTFSYLLAQKIMAMEATITQLESTLIKVRRAIYGGDRFTENSCKNDVLDRGDHFDGFVLGVDGKLKASGVDISGKINANSGSFSGELRAATGDFSGTVKVSSGVLDGVVVEGNSKFKGSLDCDSLIVDYDPTAMRRFPASGQYASNTSMATIINAVYTWMGLPTTSPIAIAVDDGYWDDPVYGGVIRAIEFYHATQSQNVTGIQLTTDRRSVVLGNSLGYVGQIRGTMWFRIGNGLKKIRLVDLPSAPGGLAGTVYTYLNPQDQKTYLMIKG